ncbi:LysR family transcriptional regulator [Xenorhabdus sp. DI]|uniref:LysR family transcriptional regulator n=1 Tax=Xenorhabdus doucetiae TaxID=351671 RepID=UPI00198D6E6B|nr:MULTISPECIES: LysR family transcriptional regulator [unclassified Xenorhabdus]MBD2786140.1 LysR family transcriptional regulator [Xenorhabdus sp. 3]MBD2788701.1 LysR family transcriptional regulator [Xenorhabdus sp. DI]
MKITLEEMQVFIAVVDCGSITAAAEQLDLTISATSRALSRLEEKMASTLLYRTTRRMKLSEEGAAFLQKAREIVKLTQEAEDLLLTRQTIPSGTLRVDASTPFLLHVINPLIGQFHEIYPQISLELTNYEGVTNLLEKRTDIAFRIGPLADSSLHATLLGYSQLRILASPIYLQRFGEPKTVDELQQHCLLGFTSPESLNEWPLYQGEKKGMKITPTIAASSGEILCNLVQKGVGIACLSDFMTYEMRESGEFRQILAGITDDHKQPINAVYYRNQALSPRLRCFIDFIKQHSRRIIRP